MLNNSRVILAYDGERSEQASGSAACDDEATGVAGLSGAFATKSGAKGAARQHVKVLKSYYFVFPSTKGNAGTVGLRLRASSQQKIADAFLRGHELKPYDKSS